jgi:programmed cell death 8 (apoptosis-inducing factor)
VESKVEGRVRLLKNRKATSLDVERRIVTLDNGTAIKYSKVLLAPGAGPKLSQALQTCSADSVMTFRTANDFKRLKQLAEDGKRIAIYGGGFLGSELAFALKLRFKLNTVVQIVPEEGIIFQVLPKYLSKWCTSKLEGMGIDIKRQCSISSVELGPSCLEISLSDGSKIEADVIVAAVGVSPQVELAHSGGLEIDEQRGGILTNAELEARSNVFAAGDAISYHDVVLGQRRRVEHHDHAVLSGITAGSNMAAKKKAYRHQSMYWSDLGPSISIEAVGITESSLPTVGVWARENMFDAEKGSRQYNDEADRGIVFYVKNERVVGILLFNVPGKIEAAKRLLAQRVASDAITEHLDAFNLHSK